MTVAREPLTRDDQRPPAAALGASPELRQAIDAVPGSRVVIVGELAPSRDVVDELDAAGITANVTVYATDLNPTDHDIPVRADIRPFRSTIDTYEWARDGRPLAAAIDVRRSETEQLALWRLLMFTLAPKAAYVAPASSRSSSHWSSRLASLKLQDKYVQEHTRALAVESAGRWAVLRKNVRHFLRVNDTRVEHVLPQRCPDLELEVLDRLPAERVGSRATVRHHPHGVRPNYPEAFEIPELSVRRYTGDIALLQNLLTIHRYTALPSSFRFPFATFPPNPRLINHNRDYATLVRPASDELARTVHLGGAYFDASSAWPHHFGHWMSEVPAKLWGWKVAKSDIPDLKALVALRPGQRASFELEVLRAFGIAENDIVVTHDPVRLRTLVAATPAWHNQGPYFGHPLMQGIWRKIGDRLAAAAETPERIFISRGDDLVRPCHQTEQIEKFVADLGFRVVYPETLPLAEQITMFRSARTIAGFTGSAMFNLMFAAPERDVVVLSSDTYTARHEYLFSALLGHRIDYFWGTADIQHPKGGWTQQAFDSPWSFDLDEHASALREVLTR